MSVWNSRALPHPLVAVLDSSQEQSSSDCVGMMVQGLILFLARGKLLAWNRAGQRERQGVLLVAELGAQDFWSPDGAVMSPRCLTRRAGTGVYSAASQSCFGPVFLWVSSGWTCHG